MPESKREVKQIVIKYICDKCAKGEMLPNGICLPSLPAQYQHTCNTCGYTQTFRGGKLYPVRTYEEV